MMDCTLTQSSAAGDSRAVHVVTVPIIELQWSVKPDRMVKGCTLEIAVFAVRSQRDSHKSTIGSKTKHRFMNELVSWQRSDRSHPHRHGWFAIAFAIGIDEHLDRLVIPVCTGL